MPGIIERFEKLIRKDTGSECWEWRGAQDRYGYGWFGFRDDLVRAHRFSYELYVGPLFNLQVLHHCDNPLCVRPDHLFLGTPADNMRDKTEKGRAGGPELKQFCVNGHDTFKVGRTTSRMCRLCSNLSAKKSRARKKSNA